MGGMKTGRIRNLRKNPTEAEKALWRHLRLRQIEGYKFRRQVPIGDYIADFVCLEKRLIIEVDGGQHSQKSSQDSKRDKWLNAQAFEVLRFWNNQVMGEIEAVKEAIRRALIDTPHLDPPPQGGRRPVEMAKEIRSNPSPLAGKAGMGGKGHE